MNNGCSHSLRVSSQRFTIGVIANRQLFASMTLARYEQMLLSGVRASASAHGCNLLLACGIGPDTSPFEELAAWPVVLPHTNFVPVGPWNASGLIFIAPITDNQRQVIAELLPPGYPAVYTSPQPGQAAVGPANDIGIAEAVDHLVAHAHRRIAFFTTVTQPQGDAAERLAAYRTSLIHHGLPFDQDLIVYGEHNQTISYQAMRQLLASGVDFSAVLASNDESATGVLKALTEAGKRVPQDVALIGFDDGLYSKAQEPPLTTVRHPTFELGYRALELLLDYIKGKRTTPTTMRVPTRLIVRESCGCRSAGALIGVRPQPAAVASPLHRSDLIAMMVEAAAVEAHQSDATLLHDRSEVLVAALLRAVDMSDATPWSEAIDLLLQQVEAVSEEIYAWHAAISALRAQLAELLETDVGSARHRLAEDFLDQSRVRLSERLLRQHTRFLMQQAAQTDLIGTMTARLLTAVESRQILEILQAHLPQIGIRHAHIALYEREGDDPVAWSNLLVHSPTGPPALRRFASRQFPPPALYPSDEPFHLALLPLVIEDGSAGFVVFDASLLEPCGLIVRHIAAALRNSQLHAAAEEGRRMAEEANRLKSRFLSTVSHELRTPLNLIVGLSEMLIRERDGLWRDSGTAIEDLERIYANAQHLGRLIGDVLDLASYEAGQLRLYMEPLDLAEVLQVVAATGAQLAHEKGLSWSATMPYQGAWVRGDRTRLRQVALNLISNAVKFTERGAVMLEVNAGSSHVTVSVSDTGPGVPLADQQAIFDEFRTSERTTARAYGGLGLGLAICKQLIQRHGGTIAVHSSDEEDSGTTFTFSLPALIGEAPERQAAHSDNGSQVVVLAERERAAPGLQDALIERGFVVQVQHVDIDPEWLPRLVAAAPRALVLDEPLAIRRGWELLGVLKRHPATAHIPVLMYALHPEDGRGTLIELDYMLKPLDSEQLAQVLERQQLDDGQGSGGRMILLVDDDAETRAMHSRLIRQRLAECRVLEAPDGRAALKIMEQTRPSLVLLDLMMPGLDGFGLLAAMREHEATRNVPVVVLTARTLSAEDMARLNQGVAAILSKGLFSGDEIIAQLTAALERQRRPGSATQQVVRKAVIYIHTHYAESISREQIAAHLAVSPDHLTVSFRQEMGITPMAYLNRYRISRARAMLADGAYNVTEVALAVGFSELANFSRSFHREVGMTPNAYRQAYKH